MYTNSVDFIWDPGKAAANFKKHEIEFREAATVFGDMLSTTFPDRVQSSPVEPRFFPIGMSNRGRFLVVVHAERKGIVRIITARRATRRERMFYEEG